MIKLWSSVLLGLAFSFVFSSTAVIAQAANMPILLEVGKGPATETDYTAVEGGRPLLPVAFLREEVYDIIALDQERKQVRVNFALPRIAFGNKNLDRIMFSNTAFSLPYTNIDGASYVDARVAEKLLGFTMNEKDGALVITPNEYSSFAPRILKETGARPNFSEEKINLAWQPTFEAESNFASNDKHVGLNVVSPSWFEIIDGEGRINNKVDVDYVTKAHEKGYQVWALITNSFDPDITNDVLHNEKARANVVKQLAAYTRLYELDGINIDFENVYDSDKDALTVFVREISEALHVLDAKVSIDVTVPSNVSQWSTCYDRKRLSESVDYVMVMAYDEHWRSSPVSGSVASIGWVEQGIINTLKEVPAEKIVLGVPFYMREWEERLSDGRKISAKTMTMERAEQTIRERNLQPVWLENQGQYYFEYAENGHRYRVWQEDARSIALKTALVNQYQLAGVAGWRKGFEKPEIWEIVHRELNPVEVQKPENDAGEQKDQVKKETKKKRFKKEK